MTGAGLLDRLRARLFPLSLRGKALLYLVPAITLVALVYTFETVQAERATLREQLLERGDTIAALTSRTAELAVLSANPAQLERSAEPLLELRDVASVTFYDRRGEPLLHRGSHPDAGERPAGSAEPSLPLVTVAERPDGFAFTAPIYSLRAQEDLDLFQEAQLVPPRRELVGFVRIGVSKEILARSEREVLVRGGLLAGLFTAAGALLVYLLVSLALKPLGELLGAVKELREGEYREVTLRAPASDVGTLVAEFNKMSRAVRDREERLTASEKKLGDLFDRVEHAIFRVQPDGAITLGNRKFEELCGAARDFDALLPGEGRRLLEQAEAGPLRAIDATVAGRDGRSVAVSLSVYPERDAAGALLGFDGHFVDVTERRKLESALAQSQRMESVGVLAGGVAHDFNNILTAILGCASLLHSRLRDDDPSREEVDEILAASERAVQVTRGLLAFSHRQVMTPRHEDLNAVVKGVERLLGRVIGEDIELTTTLAAEPLVVMADAGQLDQVLMNLAANARDAMPDGGTLAIRTERVALHGSEHGALLEAGPYALVTVSDTGHGMTPEVARRVFEPFFTTKPVGKGTGLGLSIAYGIVKQHGGFLGVYSEPGKGTTFRIYLRLVEGAASPAGRAERAPVRGGAETVLVAEDDPSVRRWLRSLLASHGYTVLEAADGEEAVRVFAEHEARIALVLLDVVMPRLNGREAWERIRRAHGERKVLFLSGYAGDVVTSKGLIEPGLKFLSKPVPPEVLLGTVRELLDRA